MFADHKCMKNDIASDNWLIGTNTEWLCKWRSQFSQSFECYEIQDDILSGETDAEVAARFGLQQRVVGLWCSSACASLTGRSMFVGIQWISESLVWIPLKLHEVKTSNNRCLTWHCSGFAMPSLSLLLQLGWNHVASSTKDTQENIHQDATCPVRCGGTFTALPSRGIQLPAICL